MRPAYLHITRVTCLATEDEFGRDDLYGILGDETFSLGSYAADEQHAEFPERAIPVGVTEFTIAESDFPDPDDALGTIDLTQDMDVDRVFGIMTGNARYDVEFKVVSEAEEASPRCGSGCPTCGNGCIKDANHGGTAHWCGQHEWGAN